MKDSISFLREKPEYEDYSDNIVILTEAEEKEFGINSFKKRCCGSSSGGCSSKKSNLGKSCNGCEGGCCSK